MEKLSVGDYVRTKSNGIKQIYEIDNKKSKYKYLFKLKKQDGDGCVDLGQLCNDNIIKHSKDIIDIIEVGDYINGWKVYEVQITNSDDERTFVSVDECYDNYCGFIHNNEIKSVLTHEQFKSNAYTIERER